MTAADAADGETDDDGVEVDYDALSTVTTSQYRKAVVEYLDERPATPTDIAETSDLGIAHISRALRECREEGVVDLLVSEETRKGRYYGLTEQGEKIAEQLEVVR